MTAIRFSRRGPALRISAEGAPIGVVRSDRRGAIRFSRLGLRGRDGRDGELADVSDPGDGLKRVGTELRLDIESLSLAT